ncbi:SdrD B-like domain-containing protein [Romboutsia sp.]|uniref:SdrD B-like domain-containing protein n=1 Tax=Romboutsia sp. TaxID=1965302 RepID=UPI003F304AF3
MAATISGIVFNDLNSDGIYNVGEPGISGAYVVLNDTIAATCINTQTDGSGNYSFSINTAGTYTVYETVTNPAGDICPPSKFTQPSGFTDSTTRRQLTVTITAANITAGTTIANNNFGHDNRTAFECTTYGWQTAAVTPGGVCNLYRVDLVNGQTLNLGGFTPATSMNSIGYNNIDGFIWGLNTTTNRIIRIAPDRTVLSLPTVPNFPLPLDPGAVGYNYACGDVNRNGYLYIYQGNSPFTGAIRFYVIDVDSNRPTYGLLVDPANGFAIDTAPYGTALSIGMNTTDWAFSPFDGQLYAVDNSTGGMLKIDPITGNVQTLSTTPSPVVNILANFFAPPNNLFGITNTGITYEYTIVGNTVTNNLVFTGQAPGSNLDGARCASSPLLGLTKSSTPLVGVGDTINYTVGIKYMGANTAVNVVFVDTIPNGTSFIDGSINLDGNPVVGSPNPPGVTLPDLSVGTHTLTFNVTVESVPTPNPTPNNAGLSYDYFDPFYGTIPGTAIISNTATTTIAYATLTSSKTVDNTFGTTGTILTYTIAIKNTGNTTASNILFVDTIPNGTTFTANSLKQDITAIVGSPNPPGISIPNPIGPGKTSTVTFKVTIITIPSPSTIPNNASSSFTFIGNPSIPTTKTDSTNSNTVITQVNKAELGLISKSVDKNFAVAGDILTYTISIPNTGTVSADAVMFKDTIPSGTTFVTNSFTVNGITKIGQSPVPPGVNIGTIPAGGIFTVTFKVTVTSIPTPNPIPNSANTTFTYKVNPSLPATTAGSANSNIVTTRINSPIISTVKSVNSTNVIVGDTIVYTVVLKNTGNTTAINMIFKDTIPGGTIFIPNSVVVNSSTVPGANPAPPSGMTLPSLGLNQTTTLTFQVTATSVPTPNPTPNTGLLNYDFIIDPSTGTIVNQNLSTNTVSTFINPDSSPTKSVDKIYAKVGDIITYTAVWRNVLNVNQTLLTFIDTIPNGTTFIANSLTKNGVVVVGANPSPPTGYAAGTLNQNTTITITFKVTVNTIPSPNPTPNVATFIYTTTLAVNPRRSNITNVVSTTISTARLQNITKSVDKTSAGTTDTLTYTISMTNNGSTTANNVIFKDTIPTGTTFVPNSATVNGVTQSGATVAPPTGLSVGSIPVGATTTITFKVQTGTTIPAPNSIPNTGTVGYNFIVDPSLGTTGSSGGNNTNTVTTKINSAIISPAKTVLPGAGFVGDILTYTVGLKNTGNTTATNIFFSDTSPNGTTFVTNSVKVNGVTITGGTLSPPPGVTIPNLGINQSATVTFRVTIDTVPSPNPTPNIGVATYSYIADPTLGTSKTNTSNSNIASAFVYPDNNPFKFVDKQYATVGDTLTYILGWVNSLGVQETNVTFVDTIPTGTTFVANSVTVNGVAKPGATVTAPNGINTLTLAASQLVTVSFKVTVNTLPTINPVPNDTTVIYSSTLVVGKQSDVSNIVNTQINLARLQGVTKSVDKNFTTVGDTLTYTITLANTGNITAENVVFLDTIPNGTSFIDGSLILDGITLPNENPDAPTGADIGTISAGAVTTIIFKVSVDTIPSPNSIPNTGNITGDYIVDPVQGTVNNISSNTNTVTSKVNFANLSNTTKAVDKIFANIGTTLTYTITIVNSGNTTANNVVFVDTVPDGTTFVLNSVTVKGLPISGVSPNPPGVTIGTIPIGGTSTVTFKVVVNTLPTINPIPNTGTVGYNFIVDPTLLTTSSGVNNTNTVETTVNHADLGKIVKFTDKQYGQCGDIVTYTISIPNSGNVDAFNVVLRDTIPTGTIYVNNSLTVDGNPVGGTPANVNIGTIQAGDTSVVFFQVQIIC